ncbi:MAG: hypothetical protein ACYDEH_08470 [Acidimicrobiales bacterium]
MSVDVVVSSETIVAGVVRIDPSLLRFPAVPPPTGIAPVDVLGAFARGDAEDFHLVTSQEIVESALSSLDRVYGFDFEHRDLVHREIERLLLVSGGGVVSTARALQVPSNLGSAASEALSCAVSADLGHPRTVVVVTDDAAAIRLSAWRPPGVPWSPESHLQILDPLAFNALVEEVRRRRRRI